MARVTAPPANKRNHRDAILLLPVCSAVGLPKNITSKPAPTQQLYSLIALLTLSGFCFLWPCPHTPPSLRSPPRPAAAASASSGCPAPICPAWYGPCSAAPLRRATRTTCPLRPIPANTWTKASRDRKSTRLNSSHV